MSFDWMWVIYCGVVGGVLGAAGVSVTERPVMFLVLDATLIIAGALVRYR